MVMNTPSTSVASAIGASVRLNLTVPDSSDPSEHPITNAVRNTTPKIIMKARCTGFCIVLLLHEKNFPLIDLKSILSCIVTDATVQIVFHRSLTTGLPTYTQQWGIGFK
jgi:hypothetical protein